jgi:hypothetical protein
MDQSAEKGSFADDILRLLVFTQANELGMPQVIVRSPFEELEMADEHWLQPRAFRHLRFRQTLTPSSASRLGEIGERAFADLESLNLTARASPA